MHDMNFFYFSIQCGLAAILYILAARKHQEEFAREDAKVLTQNE